MSRGDGRPRRMSRPEFESVLWSLAPQTASATARERLAAHDAIMRAFDAATGRGPRQRKQAGADARMVAEVVRAWAQAVNGDTPAVTAGRRDELEAALNARHDRPQVSAA